MKKFRFVFLGMTILLCVIVTACYGRTASSITDELVPENITNVELSLARGGVVESRMLTQTEIEELSAWVSQLSLTHRSFQKGEAPGDGNGQTIYTFSFNNDAMSFVWVDTGKKHYILYKDEWYETKNTSEPPFD